MTRQAYRFCLIAATLLLFLAGAFDGLTETLLHHYPAFSNLLPNADPYWWNPELSWPNKGDNFLTRTLLVWTTDAYHFTRFAARVLLAAGVGAFAITSPLPFSRVWWQWAVVFGSGMLVAWLIGFYLVWALVF